MKSSFLIAAMLGGLIQLAGLSVRADETCSSPYLTRIEGQEEFLYVWTLGVEGLGDSSDKLVVVDVKPGSSTYGKVVYQHSVGGRHEAHHGGFTDDRRQLWLSGLETSKIFIYDVYTNPAKPAFVKIIENFEKTTGGAVGPHGVYALPGRVLVPCLSNVKDKGGRTALVEYSNDGDYIAGQLHAPVLGLYGGKDQGIPQSAVDKLNAALKAAGKDKESQIHVYPDAGHAFNADYRPSYRKEAAEDGWKRMLAWFAKHGVA